MGAQKRWPEAVRRTGSVTVMPGGLRSGRLRKAHARSAGTFEAEARVSSDVSQPVADTAPASEPPRVTQARPPAAVRRNPLRVVFAL